GKNVARNADDEAVGALQAAVPSPAEQPVEQGAHGAPAPGRGVAMNAARPQAPIGPEPCPEERAALAAARAGEAGALHALLRRHVDPLLALARRLVRDRHQAEDLTQETLLAACRGLDSFRGDASIRTWLFRILIRLAQDPGRWRGRPCPASAL